MEPSENMYKVKYNSFEIGLQCKDRRQTRSKINNENDYQSVKQKCTDEAKNAITATIQNIDRRFGSLLTNNIMKPIDVH